jgi:transmembrane sensor
MDASDRRRRAAEEAAEWWVRLEEHVSSAEREQYVDWLRESPVHVAEMLRIVQVHGALAQFERWTNLPAEGSNEPEAKVVSLTPEGTSLTPPANHPKHTTYRSLLVWAVAASLVIIVGLSALFVLSARGQIIETQRGERREVALADGSVVQVDPETRLTVNYESQSRRVILERGRALFHVAKNPERPFFVRADGTTVRAVGTAFAVEQAPNAVVVTVAEGKVAVLTAHTSLRVDQPETVAASGTASPKTLVTVHAASNSTPQATGRASRATVAETSIGAAGEILLTANEQVTVGGSGTTEAVREVDSRRELAWADGRLIFENDSVEHAVREFNRYNRIQLTVTDTALARRLISGVFSASDPDSFVAFLQTVAAVHVTRDAAAGITIHALESSH